MRDTAYLLDTDVVIEYLQKKEYAVRTIEKLIENSILFISVITVLELCAGWTTKQKKQYLPLILDIMEDKEVTRDIAIQAGTYRYEWKKKGRALAPTDCIIAATAAWQEIPLVTGNIKDYPMKDFLIQPLSELVSK